MTIGAALVLIAVGAILRFAVQTVNTHGFDIHTIGDILMGVGIVGLILWLCIWAPRARGRRNVPQAPPRDAEPVPDPYRRDRRYPYRDGEYPTAEYPTPEEEWDARRGR